MRKNNHSFLRGVITAIAISSLWQDIVYGTADNFARYILNGGWVDRSITIPVAIVALVLVAISAFSQYQTDRWECESQREYADEERDDEGS